MGLTIGGRRQRNTDQTNPTPAKAVEPQPIPQPKHEPVQQEAPREFHKPAPMIDTTGMTSEELRKLPPRLRAAGRLKENPTRPIPQDEHLHYKEYTNEEGHRMIPFDNDPFGKNAKPQQPINTTQQAFSPGDKDIYMYVYLRTVTKRMDSAVLDFACASNDGHTFYGRCTDALEANPVALSDEEKDALFATIPDLGVDTLPVNDTPIQYARVLDKKGLIVYDEPKTRGNKIKKLLYGGIVGVKPELGKNNWGEIIYVDKSRCEADTNFGWVCFGKKMDKVEMLSENPEANEVAVNPTGTVMDQMKVDTEPGNDDWICVAPAAEVRDKLADWIAEVFVKERKKIQIVVDNGWLQALKFREFLLGWVHATEETTALPFAILDINQMIADTLVLERNAEVPYENAVVNYSPIQVAETQNRLEYLQSQNIDTTDVEGIENNMIRVVEIMKKIHNIFAQFDKESNA